MKKWIITILIGMGVLAIGVALRIWSQAIVEFAVKNKEKVDSIKGLIDLLALPASWVISAIIFYFKWRRGKNEQKSKAAQTLNIQDTRAERDVIAAGGSVQTGGVSIPAHGNISVNAPVAGRDMTVNVLPAVPNFSALHQLPPPPRDFTGRELDIMELRNAMETSGVSGVQGQGGIGKTSLALKVAEELVPKYPDAQIYLDLKGASDRAMTSGEAMTYVIRAFYPEAKLPESENNLSAAYFSVLHGKRALLLMDNAKDAAQVKPLVPPAGCGLMVTSRQQFVLPDLHVRRLETLPLPEAKTLLLVIAPRIGGEAEKIASRCGFLPQRLRVAASAIAERPDLDPADYARRLGVEENRPKLLAAGNESVEASISLSYNLLDSDTQKRWQMLSVFPDTFDAPAAAAVWEMEGDAPKDGVKDTLSRLLQFSMLEWNETTNRYRLHDLMRDFARNKCSDVERNAAAIRHATHYLIVLNAADELYLKGGESLMRGLAMFDSEWRNIQAGQAWAAVHTVGDDIGAKLCSNYPNVGAYCLNLRQPPRERICWLEEAINAARQLKDHEIECAHLGNLALAYANLGETRRAIEYYEQHLANTRDVGDRRGEGNALGNLGLAYAALGETRRAIEYYEQQLAITRDVGDRRGEGNALGNLGLAYADLGETRRAIEYSEQRLAIAREIGDRRGEGNALFNMSLALDELGERKKAINHAEVALNVYDQIEDPNAAKVRKQLDEWKKS